MAAPAPVATYPVDRSGGYEIALSELEGYHSQGPGKPSGGKLRFYCPIHGGDSQQSLEYDPATGRFHCFACQAWGYTTEARARWKAEHNVGRSEPSRAQSGAPALDRRPPLQIVRPKPIVPARPPKELEDRMFEFVEALPGSPGEEYLHMRRVPLSLAMRYGIGYAAPGRWPGRSAPRGRVVFPHYAPPGPDGTPFLVNLYGRAVEFSGLEDRSLRHNHLAGSKGWFNRSAVDFVNGGRAVYVCEGSFDAVALIAAGVSPRALAIFGLDSLRWSWLPSDARIVLALDADARATDRVTSFLYEALALGRDVVAVDPAVYGGAKDAAEAWRVGTLDVGALRLTGEG
jgi:hypothetical protein